MKTMSHFPRVALSVALVGIFLLPAGVPAQTTEAAGAEPRQSLKIPSKLDEIAALSKAGVGDPVILSYIKNSETAYNLNAQDIIKLRDQGVSAEVTAALIQRGTEVRHAAQQAAKESQTAVAAAAPAYQTPVAVETPAPATHVTTPVQPASSISVTYIGYPSYSYSADYYPRYHTYPGYVSFGSSYYYAPRVSFGVGFYGGHRFGGYRSSARYCR